MATIGGTMTDFTITIPAVPPSANTLLRLHWAKRKRFLDEWTVMLWALMNEARVPRMDPCHLTAVIYFATNRTRDADNYEFGLKKLTQDAIVRCGFLPDDSPEHVTWGAVEMAVDREMPRTEVTLTPA